MSLALGLVSLAMRRMSVSCPEVPRSRRKAGEAVHGEDIWLGWLEIQGHDGRKSFLGRFKRAPVTPPRTQTGRVDETLRWYLLAT